MSSPGYLLAVDGGGTKTQAIVADLEGKVLARGLGPSSNHHRVGLDAFGRALTTAIDGALQHVLGPRPKEAWHAAPIAAACFGLAGVDCKEDETLVSTWVKAQGIAPSFVVVNDSQLVLAAGTPEGWGVALISGTGSVCLGRSKDGRSRRAGGWGPLLGDEGSGYQIALRALRAATQTADGRAGAQALLQAVLRHWGLDDASALIPHVYSSTMNQSELAGLAVVVLELAGKGDPVAAGIVTDAAQQLAAHVDALVHQLELTRPPLALAGGVLRATLRNSLQAAIRSELGPISYVADPSLGGVALARRLLE